MTEQVRMGHTNPAVDRVLGKLERVKPSGHAVRAYLKRQLKCTLVRVGVWFIAWPRLRKLVTHVINVMGLRHV